MLSPPTVCAFSVAADIDSSVFDFNFFIWSLSRLLCCVGSGSNVAVALHRTAHGIGLSIYRNALSASLAKCNQKP